MSKSPLEILNDDIIPVDDIIIPFLKGAGLIKNSLYLNGLVQQSQKDAVNVYLKQTNPKDIDNILTTLTDDVGLKQKLKNDYELWLRELHVSHNLIHFLEFLSTKNYHRIRNLLKAINEHEYKNSHVFLYLSTALGTLAGIGCYLYAHPEQWDILIQFLLEKLPEYSKTVLALAMSAEILSGLIVIRLLMQFFYETFKVLNNKTTKTQIKFAKLSKINAYYLLSIAAQILIFFNSGTTTTISGVLFFLAAVVTLALSALEYYHHKVPQEPEHKSIKNNTHYAEELSYYERKKMQFYAEFISLFPITIISIASIFLCSHYVFLTPIFASSQFLIATLKDIYIKNQSKDYANQLQTTIRQEFKNEEKPEDVLKSISQLVHQPRSSDDIIRELQVRFNLFDHSSAEQPTLALQKT